MELLCTVLYVFLVVLMVRIVLSWFPPGGRLLETVREYSTLATEWILGPLRRALPPVRLGAAALDLSPMVVMLGIIVAQGFVCG